MLCEQFNGYAAVTEEIEMLDEDWTLQALRGVYDPKDIAILIQDDFGRGILMGQLAYLRAVEAAQEQEEGSTGG